MLLAGARHQLVDLHHACDLGDQPIQQTEFSSRNRVWQRFQNRIPSHIKLATTEINSSFPKTTLSLAEIAICNSVFLADFATTVSFIFFNKS